MSTLQASRRCSPRSAIRPPAELIDRAVGALYATDDFQQVILRTEARAGRDSVIIEPKEKSWGPNYLRFGTSLSTDLEGESGFNLCSDLRVTWLNRKGLEWRSSVAVGDVMGMRSELLQPVDLQRQWLGSVYVDARRRVDSLYLDDEAVTNYRNSVLRTGVGVRSRFFTDSEVFFALQRSWYDLRRQSGIDYGTNTQTGTAALLRYTVDRLDHWDFPRAGFFASASYEQSFDVFGDDTAQCRLANGRRSRDRPEAQMGDGGVHLPLDRHRARPALPRCGDR